MSRPTRRARVVAALSCVAAAAAAVLAAPVVAPAAATPAAAAASTLAQGRTLASRASLLDAASGQRLTMQGDGNAVLTYVPAGRVLWSTRTSVPGSTLAFRSTGDLKVVTPAGAVVWHSNTSAPSGLVLGFDPCGRMAISPQWASNACTVAGTLVGSRVSPDGRSRATQQSDGNFVVTTTVPGPGTRVLWASSTSGAVTAVVQRDQNFLLYKGTSAVWSSRTTRAGCAGCVPPTLTMQDDGNLVLYPAAGGTALWSTRTSTTSWADPSLLMTSSSLGPVRVGMTLVQAKAAAGVPLDDNAPACLVAGSHGGHTDRLFAYDGNGRVTMVLSGNSTPFYDHTAAGITATSTGNDVLRAYGSAARSYTDIYGTFVVLVRTSDGNELRFDMFDGRSGKVSIVSGGVPAVVEQTEICG